MWLAVVSVCKSRFVEVPVSRMMVQIALDSSVESSVESFYLTVRLGMIRHRELITPIQNSANVLEELACKVLSVI